MTKLRKYDTVRYLDSEEMIGEYYSAVCEDGTPAEIGRALGMITQAKTINDLAKKTGRTYQEIYEVLNGEDNPDLSTILDVVKALGLQQSSVGATKKKQAAA